MSLIEAESLFQKPIHKEAPCPWITEDYFGNMHLCAECEENEILQQEIDDSAEALIETGVVGVRNVHEIPELNDAWTEALNIVVKDYLVEKSCQ